MSALVVFAVELVGTLVLVGVASGAAVAGVLNVTDDAAERGLIGEHR